MEKIIKSGKVICLPRMEALTLTKGVQGRPFCKGDFFFLSKDLK